jgi:acyl-homoserine-lactone acylase
MLQMPMFTTVYADRDGHILHLFGGRTPVRPAGVDDWSGIVPGGSAATLWRETHPYRDLPRALDPASGWLQNANDPPWTTTFPAALDPGRFPRYMAPRFMHLRAQRSVRMLAENRKLSFEDVVAAKLSTRMELADRILDDLAVAVGPQGDPVAHRALTVLVDWDRSADAGSRGAVLFARFFRELPDQPFAVAWDESRPLETPDGLADPAAASAAFLRAARGVVADFGSLDVPWGEVYRLRLDGRDLPANGGAGSLGIFRVVDFDRDGDGKRKAVGGDSFVAVVEFGEKGARASALLSYGNASQPGSRHRGDQLELFAKKELRPVWRSRAEIERHLAAREVVGQAP